MYQVSKMRFISLVLALVGGWLCFFHILLVAGDIGTATSYDPPYLPTRCKGHDKEQFPEGGLFVAACEGIWDNGAACGRRYRVRCISGLKRPCRHGSIVVQVVDVCRTIPCPATLLLSNTAFDYISKYPTAKINVEYAQ
ncbi:EG45-like domain containing protein [Actinidia eriantha]|uniref:EG45-like domain containing protein n=1 Tax=Actinidia eriantha TaxID=165200 RepID=UPI002582AFEF|nr:EG45-like domain containing protein [Actinidia eriantha]